MKKILVTIATIIMLATSAFANDAKVKSEILNAFQAKFGSATEVTWTTANNYYKAAFNYKGMWMSAYYSNSAELLGLTRNVASTQLPYFLQKTIQKTLSNSWITDLYEVSDDQGFRYYLTLKTADTEIVLESINGSDWRPYHLYDEIYSVTVRPGNFDLRNGNATLFTEFLNAL